MSAITDAMRLALHNRAREIFGHGEGDTLMAHLPPVGWADVATNKDVDHAVTLIQKELDMVPKRDEMERGFRRQAMWIATLFVAQQASFVYMVERLAP